MSKKVFVEVTAPTASELRIGSRVQNPQDKDLLGTIDQITGLFKKTYHIRWDDGRYEKTQVVVPAHF